MHTHSFIGNLTRDCRIGQSSNGSDVANFSVAVNNRRTNATNYVDCSLWGKNGISLQSYLVKGTKVFISGDFGTDEYNGATKITCNVAKVELLGGRNRTSSETEQGNTEQLGQDIRDDEIPF